MRRTLLPTLILPITLLSGTNAWTAEPPEHNGEECEFNLTPEEKAEIRKFSKDFLRNAGFGDAAEMSDEEMDAYQNIVTRLPRTLQFDEVVPAMTVVDFDESAIAFIEKLCEAIPNPFERMSYFYLMIRRNITGATVARFDSLIGHDIHYGFDLLRDNDPLLRDDF